MLDLTDVVQGPVPLLAWLGAAAVGFVLPDLARAARLQRRRAEINGCLGGEVAVEGQHVYNLIEQ